MQNNQGGQIIQIQNGNGDRILDQLEIKPINQNTTRFNQLIQVWKEFDIPICHQKYYYNVILTHQQQADDLMRIEIESIKNNKSVVRTLHQLTIGRERCLKEISKLNKANYSDYLKTISKFIYDLRKLTLNLMEFHRKWRNNLKARVEHNYIWKIKDRDYLHQIKEDHKFIQNHHPKTKSFFSFREDDIFYLSVVQQAEQEDQQKYDHLEKHKIDKKYIDKMKDLQEYFNSQIIDYKPVKLGQKTSQNHDDQNSPGFQGRNNINLGSYESKVIYTEEGLSFQVVSYPFKDLQAILENWSFQNVQELNSSFKYPIKHIYDLLLYWQEAAIVRIDQNGLLICSIDQEFSGRRWIIHQIYLAKNSNWQQRLNDVIKNFIKMLKQKGDSFTSLAICCSNDQQIKGVLGDLKFTFSKNITYSDFNVVIYEQKIQNVQQNMIRQYFTPLTLRMFRVYAQQTDYTLITNEELLIAQYCSNLGRNTIIRFENNILTLSPYLNKSKLYGQEYMLIQKPSDIATRYHIDFSTPVQSAVYFQLFNVKLNFKFFSSEFYRNSTQPYLRIAAHPTQSEQEPSILQLSSSEISNSTIYLISTNDPFIKIFIQEVQPNQISKQNIQSYINQTFEKFDRKQEYVNNIWLPQFKCGGKQLKLNDANIEGYFQNDTFLQVQYPRNGTLHSNKYFNDNDKIISTPFLFGIVQSDLESINKPLFSILIEKEHVIKTSEKTINNAAQVYNIVSLQPQDGESVLIELFRNTAQDIKKSFGSDTTYLMQKLKYSLECSLINLNIGHALIYVDENHIFEKRWIIETVMINDINGLTQLLSNLVQYIFTNDPSANEIKISQTHYLEQQQLIENKVIMNSIKQARFRWRQVDNDAKTQLRRTIYFVKRSIQDYPSKLPNQVSIQFKSYYAIQQSEGRNEIQNKLEYLNSTNEYQIFEDCFHYQVNGQVPSQVPVNSYLYNGLQKLQGKLPNSEFLKFNSLEQLKAQVKFQSNLPVFESKFEKFDILLMNTQLKIKKQRLVIHQGKEYLEIPNNSGHQQIFQSENYQDKQNFYFIATQDPLYFMYFIELGDPKLKEQIQQNPSNIASQVSQAFLTKYLGDFQLVWIEQFQKITQIHQNQNFLFIDFALKSQFSIEQSMIFEDGPKNQEKIQLIKLPIFCGLLNTNVRTQIERPLVGMIIE